MKRDCMVVRKKLFFFTLSLLPLISIAQTKQITSLSDFLQPFYDFSSLPLYENNVYSAEVSTYDTTGGNNDGFNGTYSFIRRNADSSLVLFDQKGPGVINRFWTPTPTKDTLDFYIDDTSHVSFSICYMDLYSGKVYPFVAPLCSNQLGGYYCYLPIPFANSCKVVLKAKSTQFHQIGYKLYDKSKTIKSFSLQIDEATKQSLEKIITVFDKISSIQIDKNNSTNEVQKKVSINPGENVEVYSSNNPGRIIGFEILSSSALTDIAKNIDLKITWDNEATPAVYCPLADYFGYAFGKPSMIGLMAGSDGKNFYSRFPMPYDKSAKIELMYRKPNDTNMQDNVSLLVKVYSQNKRRDVTKEGKFYAAWSNENPVPTGKPYTILDAKGKGNFVGVVLQAQGLQPGMTIFFEGDDSTVIDGETRFHGTGSEDFFNGGWYALLDRWDDAMSLPLSGSLGYSTALSRTGAYRYFITDKMSFAKSFLLTIEHGPSHNLYPSNYTSVSYYYCDSNNTQQIIPDNTNTKINKPDTLEFFPQITPSAIDGRVNVQTGWDGPAQKMFYTINSEALIKYYLRDVQPGKYMLYIDFDKQLSGTKFSVWQRQIQVSDWTDSYNESLQKLVMQKIGLFNFSDNNQTVSFRFKITGDRNKFNLGRIILVRQH